MKAIPSGKAGMANILLAVSFAIFGCSNQSPTQPNPARAPGSPRDALIQLCEAMHEGNESKLLAALEATEEQKELFLAMMDYIGSTTVFRDEFVKAYGEQAWNDFQDDSKKPKDGNVRFIIPDFEERIARIDKLQIDQRSEKASCESVLEPGKTMRFTKHGRGWHVDAGSICPPTDELNKHAKHFRAVAASARKYQRAIGRPGIHPEDIEVELSRELIKVEGLEPAAPQRFDVDQLIRSQD